MSNIRKYEELEQRFEKLEGTVTKQQIIISGLLTLI